MLLLGKLKKNKTKQNQTRERERELWLESSEQITKSNKWHWSKVGVKISANSSNIVSHTHDDKNKID